MIEGKCRLKLQCSAHSRCTHFLFDVIESVHYLKMAPHLSSTELAKLRQWMAEGMQPIPMWNRHWRERQARRVKPICLTAFRKALHGVTHRGGKERRGRKGKLSLRAVHALDKKRHALTDACSGGREVPWTEVIHKARVKRVHPTTAKRSLVRAGIPVASRRCREKPHCC